MPLIARRYLEDAVLLCIPDQENRNNHDSDSCKLIGLSCNDPLIVVEKIKYDCSRVVTSLHLELQNEPQ